MSLPKNILVFRFSSFGDVALVAPVLKTVLKQNSEVKITLITPKFMFPFFQMENLTLVDADLKGKHKGFLGLIRLFFRLKSQKFDAIADLHSVLRTHILRFFFTLIGTKTAQINKGRTEKKQLTQKENKQLKPLQSTTERYADVFRKLGLKVELDHELKPQIPVQKEQSNTKKIGIAPFAQHQGKMYPLDKTREIVDYFAQKEIVVYLFGSREEGEIMKDWEQKQIKLLAGKLKLTDELQQMAQMDVMLTMDSANTHLASLVGVPAVSVWGATHPFAGFMGYGQSEENAVQINNLSCRPCSVFGNKPCWRNDYACMNDLPTEKIISKIERLLFI